MNAVLQIIRSSGPNAVTMEAVSALSGVAKTTLYRRYKDRYDLMEDVASRITPVTYPPTGLTADSLAQMVRGLQDTFESQVGYAFVGHLLASSDDFMVAWREKIISPRIVALRSFFERGVADGVLRADADYQMLIEFIMGGAVMCAALRGHVPADWAEDVAQTVWPIIAAAH